MEFAEVCSFTFKRLTFAIRGPLWITSAWRGDQDCGPTRAVFRRSEISKQVADNAGEKHGGALNEKIIIQTNTSLVTLRTLAHLQPNLEKIPAAEAGHFE